MSILRIYKAGTSEFQEFKDFEEIRSILSGKGILFERWETNHPVSRTATPEEVLSAYKASIERLKNERGFKAEDVVAIHSETPNHSELRKKFLGEHTHTDDEARFFVDGRGLFYINGGAQVFALLCEKGDLVNVPAGTKHWYDMGSNPFFQCVRVFTDQAGWVGHFTGSDLPGQYPPLDEYPAN